MQHPTILIADDEPGIVALLRDYFEMQNFRVLTAPDGPTAVAKSTQNPDIILLDINMPGLTGLEVCARIREHVACPIVFLTARVEDADKITGLLQGGDDYVTKPFSIDELGARVSAHLRRDARRAQASRVAFSGDLTIDYTARTLTHAGQDIPLAKKEFDILAFLSMHAGQVFDRERLYEAVWGLDAQGDSSVLAEHVKRIRAKLQKAGAENPIETVWGVGYRWQK